MKDQPNAPVGTSSRWRGIVLLLAVFLAGAAAGGVAVWAVYRPKGPKQEGPADSALELRASLGVRHFARLAGGEAEPRGRLGTDSLFTHFEDQVRVEVELSAPAHLFLLAFNADGTEQLLWPKEGGSEPPSLTRLVYPTREGRSLVLDSDPAGGLQAFAVGASSQPLPAYEVWRAKRPPPAWRKLPAGKGVWAADAQGVYQVDPGMRLRDHSPKPPPLFALVRSLLDRGGELVEVLAFPVLPRKGR